MFKEDKFIDFNDEQFWNIPLILVTLLRFKEDKSKEIKDEHLYIHITSVTFLRFEEDKSKDFKDKQFLTLHLY